MDVYYTPPHIEIVPSNEECYRMMELSSSKVKKILPSVHGYHQTPRRGSKGSIPSVHATSSHSSAQHSDVDEDHALEDLQRNIETLERSLQNKETVIDIESGDESRARKLKIAGKRILR